LEPGAEPLLELRVAPGQRGPQVTEVISVDSSTAAPSRPPPSRTMKPNLVVALHHFTVPVSWTLASQVAWSESDLKLARGG
jgi:hypothetical protein